MEMQNILKRRLKLKKILVIVGATILIIVAITSIGNSNHQPKSVRGNNLPTEQPKKQEQVTAIKTDSQPAVETSANDAKSSQQNQSANPSKPISEEDQLKQLVSRQLKSTTSGGKERIRKIEVIEQYDGGWGVFTEYNADDVMTANLTKKSIELDMTDLYKALYTSGKNISSASITVYLTLVDKYGKESDSVVYGTILDKSEANKVNWNMDRSYLGLNIMPNVWTTKFINAEFRD